ncbi:hypothetical protein D3C72_1200040 [compost metagenome]
MRIASGPGGRQPDGFQQFRDAILAVGFIHILVQPQGFTDDLLNRHARIERGERVLKDDLQFTTKLVQARTRRVGNLFALIEHAPFAGRQ